MKTLLQSIQVLSAGANIEPDKEGKPQQVQVVNLLVTPHQAEILSLAAGNDTRIQLVLRNPMDTEVTAPPGTSMSELFGGSLFGGPGRAASAPRPPEPVAPAPVAAMPPPGNRARAIGVRNDRGFEWPDPHGGPIPEFIGHPEFIKRPEFVGPLVGGRASMRRTALSWGVFLVIVFGLEGC